MSDMTMWTMTLAQEAGSEVLGAPSGGGAPTGGGVEGVEGTPGEAVPGGAPSGTQQAPGGMKMMLPLLFGLMIFMVVTSMLSGRKEKKKRAELMSNLKRRDKVQTIGGIIGTIAEIKSDEVVLKVDHGSQTRIRFARSAIQQVLHSAAGTDDGSALGEDIEELELENPTLEQEAMRV